MEVTVGALRADPLAAAWVVRTLNLIFNELALSQYRDKNFIRAAQAPDAATAATDFSIRP